MNKLLLLDGPNGVGKTSVAHYICAMSNGKFKCIDPDKYYNNNIVRYAFRGRPISNNCVIKTDIRCEVEKQIKETNVVIPLTLDSIEYRKAWIFLFQDIADVKHIILYANKEKLRSRITADPRRDHNLALDDLDDTAIFYQKYVEGICKIDTSELTPEEVARTVLRLVE